MLKSLLYKIKLRSFSLRFSLLSIFIILFVLLTLLIALIRNIAFKNELLYTSHQLMKNTSNLVLKEITTDINPIQINGNFSANIFSSGLIKDDPDKLITYTYYLVNSIPLLQGAYWGNKHGDLVYAAQEADGTISSEVILRSHFPFSHTKTYHDLKGNITKKLDLADNHFDPRTRPWYIKASTSHGVPAWTPVYMFYALNTLGITLAAPVMDKQKNFLGAFGLDISLDFLSQFITKLSISPNGYAFIITKDEDLIAYSRIKPFLETKALPNQLLNVHKSSNLTLIDKSIDYYKKMGESEFTIEYQGEDYLVSYRPIPAFVTEGWLIGVIAPQNDFIGYLHKINMITFMFAMLILGIGLLITSRLVTLIVKPIKILVKETEKIKRFELDNKIHLSSRIKEVINLRDALASMKNGLQQFQRYLPKVLVRQLIESGQNIHVGGVRKELVVFFSDIENFTTIAETLDPNELMTQICEYFEVLTQIIILEKGTIDKYIGDSIMAFWGAPLHTTHASKHAARSALHCITAVEELNAKWASQGRPQLITRIGIHKGEAIVGNLGSSERLNYTALGDAINIANRLETINKTYKTHIIIGDTMYDELKNEFCLRMLDSVIVKGRKKTLKIYELLGEAQGELSFDLRAYNLVFKKGFSAYQKQEWQAAITHFHKCLELYSADSVAPIFIERCLSQITR